MESLMQVHLIWLLNQIFFFFVGHFSNVEKAEEAQAAIQAVTILAVAVVDPKNLPLILMLHHYHTLITYNTKKIIHLLTRTYE